MKKVLAILLPLTLLVSAVSCSEKTNSSDSPETPASTSQSLIESNYTDPASENTNYTRGYIKDKVYINEYANIKMEVPDTLVATLSDGLSENKNMFVESLGEGPDKTRESARIWDAQFANPQENVAVNFINTKLAFPDSSEVTEDDVLASYKAYIDNAVASSGTEVKWKEKEKATIGGAEYIGNIAYYGGSDSNYEALFMRKLDDSLICWIHFSSNSPDKTPEYYEKLFS